MRRPTIQQTKEIQTKCTICSHLNPMKTYKGVQLYPNHIFGHLKEDPIFINLCGVHDVEFFKIGQERFMKKYLFLAFGLLETFHPAFINRLIEIKNKSS